MNRFAAPYVVLALAMPAFGGRPLATEDASILEAKACQLEMWADRGRNATELWAAPACNFGADIEWQLGGSRTFESGSAALTQTYFQAKTVFRSVEDHPWGAGLVLGMNRLPRRETHNGWGDPYVLLPVSFKLGESGNVVHLNAGWLRDRADRRNLTLWGVAIEAPAGKSLTLVAEIYGENSSKPLIRAGGRFNAVEDRLDFDLTVVTRAGGTSADRFVSLGLYYKTDAFLP